MIKTAAGSLVIYVKRRLKEMTMKVCKSFDKFDICFNFRTIYYSIISNKNLKLLSYIVN